VLTEIYRKKDYVPELTIKELAWQGSNALVELPTLDDDGRMGLYRKLGFEGLEKIVSKPDPADWYPELTASEELTWRQFLPAAYVNSHRDGLGLYRAQKWSEYCFDKIPLPILKELETARNLGLFDCIVIRTPERNQSDPVAIGYHLMPNKAIRHFLICRWGESLIPYWQVWLRSDVLRTWVLFVLPPVALFAGILLFLGK
jgi:hypothetical protein